MEDVYNFEIDTDNLGFESPDKKKSKKKRKEKKRKKQKKSKKRESTRVSLASNRFAVSPGKGSERFLSDVDALLASAKSGDSFLQRNKRRKSEETLDLQNSFESTGKEEEEETDKSFASVSFEMSPRSLTRPTSSRGPKNEKEIFTNKEFSVDGDTSSDRSDRKGTDAMRRVKNFEDLQEEADHSQSLSVEDEFLGVSDRDSFDSPSHSIEKNSSHRFPESSNGEENDNCRKPEIDEDSTKESVDTEGSVTYSTGNFDSDSKSSRQLSTSNSENGTYDDEDKDENLIAAAKRLAELEKQLHGCVVHSTEKNIDEVEDSEEELDEYSGEEEKKPLRIMDEEHDREEEDYVNLVTKSVAPSAAGNNESDREEERNEEMIATNLKERKQSQNYKKEVKQSAYTLDTTKKDNATYNFELESLREMEKYEIKKSKEIETQRKRLQKARQQREMQEREMFEEMQHEQAEALQRENDRRQRQIDALIEGEERRMAERQKLEIEFHKKMLASIRASSTASIGMNIIPAIERNFSLPQSRNSRTVGCQCTGVVDVGIQCQFPSEMQSNLLRARQGYEKYSEDAYNAEIDLCKYAKLLPPSPPVINLHKEKPVSMSKEAGSNTSFEVVDIEDLVAAHSFSSDEVKTFQEKLRNWYLTNRRKLPWRGDCPPYEKRVSEEEDAKSAHITAYETWVSEVMLQQTRVATVITYYTRWMKEFPTVHALAEASPEAVNAQWAGLGYYSRARNLHKGAKLVVDKYDGKFPSTVEELLKIPGIGKYTAGAVASLAFGIRAPLVDGNVIRVFSRLRAIELTKKAPLMHKLCWRLANVVVPDIKSGAALGSGNPLNFPGVFNQALMELGATICTPKVALCTSCPISSICQANETAKSVATASKETIVNGILSSSATQPYDVTRFPLQEKKKPPKDVYRAICVVKCKSTGRILVRRRPDKGLLAGQFEPFPAAEIMVPMKPSKSNIDSIPEFSLQNRLQAIEELVRSEVSSGRCSKSIGSCILGKKWLKEKELGIVVHTFSHRRHHMKVQEVVVDIEPEEELKDKENDGIVRAVSWISEDELGQFGITTCARKIFSLAGLTIGGNRRKTQKKRKKSLKNESRKKTKPLTHFFKKESKEVN
eukprot:g310.t1